VEYAEPFQDAIVESARLELHFSCDERFLRPCSGSVRVIAGRDGKLLDPEDSAVLCGIRSKVLAAK